MAFISAVLSLLIFSNQNVKLNFIHENPLLCIK